MWIDRVALEQPASTAAPACSQAELIRATLARAQIPFLTGHAGMVNGKARGGQQHEYMAHRLRYWKAGQRAGISRTISEAAATETVPHRAQVPDRNVTSYSWDAPR